MGFFSLLFPWGVLLQALAIVHFIRRRPDTIWLWVIIFFGPLGALVYIAMEVVPDLGLLRQSFDGVGRRKRIRLLEAIVLENSAAGNYEELADLYLEEANTRGRATAMTRRSRRGSNSSTRSTGAGSQASTSATLRARCRISST